MLVDTLSCDSPNLYATLQLSDLTQLVSLSAEIFALTHGAWSWSPDSDEVIPFIRLALNPSISHEDCRRLWKILFPIFGQSRVEPALLIHKHGYSHGLTVQIPEVFLTPRVKNCLVCPTSNHLQHRSQIDGYLYDVDGVHTARIFTMKCPSECPTILTTLTWANFVIFGRMHHSLSTQLLFKRWLTNVLLCSWWSPQRHLLDQLPFLHDPQTGRNVLQRPNACSVSIIPRFINSLCQLKCW